MKLAVVLRILLLCTAASACSKRAPHPLEITISASAVGAEGEVLRRQLARFEREHPGIRVVQRRTPDAADQRHQLYVQWLNAQAPDPDVLQLDVIWPAEFGAAGWLHELDTYAPDVHDFFPATVEVNRWRGRVVALPWFVDVGMLYYRRDLLPEAPRSYAELVAQARTARQHGLSYGLVWQGARYEGLVTVFTEYLAQFGGEILDDRGRVWLESNQAHAALEAMRTAIGAQGIVPRAALSWQEEQSRFAFQNGHALFMRNWPYAYALMQQPGSRVAGRVGVAAIPAAPGGRSAAALGGSQLAINAHSDHPDIAYQLIAFLTAPAQMLERAQLAGELPPRRSLYAQRALADVLPFDAATAQRIVASAVARPATPVYAELSDILQIHLHRCLSGQESSAGALHAATLEIDALFERVGLAAHAQRALQDGHHG